MITPYRRCGALGVQPVEGLMTESIARETRAACSYRDRRAPRSRSRRVRALSRTETLVLRDLVHLLEELLGAIDQICDSIRIGLLTGEFGALQQTLDV